MFAHPGLVHAILLVLLVATLFAARRVRRPGNEMIEARTAARRLIVLELLELGLAAVFFLVGGAKLVGRPDMVALFRDIGVGQWLRYLTGALEVVGATLMLVPFTSGAAALALGAIMVVATLIELFVLHRAPVAALTCLSGHVYVAWARLASTRQTTAAQPTNQARSPHRHSHGVGPASTSAPTSSTEITDSAVALGPSR